MNVTVNMDSLLLSCLPLFKQRHNAMPWTSVPQSTVRWEHGTFFCPFTPLFFHMIWCVSHVKHITHCSLLRFAWYMSSVWSKPLSLNIQISLMMTSSCDVTKTFCENVPFHGFFTKSSIKLWRHSMTWPTDFWKSHYLIDKRLYFQNIYTFIQL